jgi:hypothetical protein
MCFMCLKEVVFDTDSGNVIEELVRREFKNLCESNDIGCNDNEMV